MAVHRPKRVHDLLRAAAARHPERPAVRDRAGRWTYRELADAAQRSANRLAEHGAGPGTRVVSWAKPSREYLALLYGTSLTGATFVPLHHESTAAQRERVVAETSPALVAADADPRGAWRAAPPPTPEPDSGRDTALLIYTSGSTAFPKGIVCPHERVLFAVRAISAVLAYRSDDVVFCRLPLSFDYGLYQVFLAADAGAELVLAHDCAPARLHRLLTECRGTVLPVVPSLAGMLLALRSRAGEPSGSTVRMITNTGETLPPATVSNLRRAFPGAGVYPMYGISECKRVSVLTPEESASRPGSVGRPLPGTRVSVVSPQGRDLGPGSVGQIVVRGPHVMAGYWRSPESTERVFPRIPGTAERELRTGDSGYLDADGYLYFTGRSDSVFKRRGTRMSTAEIEAAARGVPGVGDAVALPPAGRRDLTLFVAGTTSGAEVLTELATVLDPARLPAVCHVLPRLPLTANGKVDRDRLARTAGPGGGPPPAPPPVPGGSAGALDDALGEQLVARYGSPLYVYELDRADRAVDDLRRQLPPGALLYYSVKANPHPGLIRRLRIRGSRAEVSSTGELDAALAGGHRADDVLYTGPGKTPGELSHALARGVGTFSAESLADLERVSAAAREAGQEVACLLRINAPQAVGGSGLRMTGTASQFGSDADQLVAEWRGYATPPGVRVIGLHFFPLTNATDEDTLIAETRQSVAYAAWLARELGLDLTLLDLGGGFACPYAVPGHRPRYPRLREHLTRVLDTHLPGWRRGRPHIAFESGRYLVGDSGTLLTTVTETKRSHGRSFAVLDAGINTLGGLSGLGRLRPHQAVPAPPDAAGAENADAERVTLAGPLCTPVDLLARQLPDPGLTPGRILRIPNTGAYGLTASLLGFLSRPAPCEVLLDAGQVVESGRIALTRTRHREEP